MNLQLVSVVIDFLLKVFWSSSIFFFYKWILFSSSMKFILLCRHLSAPLRYVMSNWVLFSFYDFLFIISFSVYGGKFTYNNFIINITTLYFYVHDFDNHCSDEKVCFFSSFKLFNCVPLVFSNLSWSYAFLFFNVSISVLYFYLLFWENLFEQLEI